MKTWTRTAVLGTKLAESVETWTSPSGKEYTLSVKYGKPLDFAALMSPVLENLKLHVREYRELQDSLFSGELEHLYKCPLCNGSHIHYQLKISVGVYYHCQDCDHYFLISRSTDKSLNHFYQNSAVYANCYTDSRTLDIRKDQIAIPKRDWVIKQYLAKYGRRPQSILDVGAGGGHFAYACKLHGIKCTGIEVSKPSIVSARDNFGIVLDHADFVSEGDRYSDYDVITFWGVLEHVPRPNDFLTVAYEILSGRETMVVVSVPRWNCFDTAIQTSFPGAIIRHLDPAGHIHCFSDTSLATAFERNKVAPYAAWYYGMDVYELMVQLAYHTETEFPVNVLNDNLVRLQSSIDSGWLSDEIALAGVPE